MNSDNNYNNDSQPSTKASKGGEKNSYEFVYSNIISEPLVFRPLEVKVINNFDKAMRAFRALVQKERVVSIYKESCSYEKPSEKRRRKKNEAKRKLFETNKKIDKFTSNGMNFLDDF